MLKPMIAVSALLISTSAWAQPTPETEPTAQELACQLSPECMAATQEPAGDTPQVGTTPETGGARKPQTRGFSIKPRAPEKSASQKPQLTPTKPRVIPGNAVKASGNAPALPRADLRVSFITGSAELTEVGRRRAATFVEALKLPLLSGARFIIAGHTDAVGSREQNLDLSRRRAQAVVDYLVLKGAEAARFDVQGYGFDKPLPGWSPRAAENRRVEVLRIK